MPCLSPRNGARDSSLFQTHFGGGGDVETLACLRRDEPVEDTVMTIRVACYTSPLGRILAAVTDDAVTGLWFEGQRHFPPLAATWAEDPDNPALTQLFGWLDAYFAGDRPAAGFRLAPQGTPFQLRVWSALRQIPYGETTTYGAIASRLGAQSATGRTSARAVGGAVSRNPISLVIPCHRVIGASGSLTGYAGGLDRKTALLALEGASRVSLHPGHPRILGGVGVRTRTGTGDGLRA
jgi:methylated-DNA-[protein]-cysteine S-methyltransferase